MTSNDGGAGRDPLDPDFAGLFRPDDPSSAPVDYSPPLEPSAPASPEPRTPEPVPAEAVVEEVAAQAAPDMPAPPPQE